LSDVSILGSETKSERAEEVWRQSIRTNTSCSLYARINHNRQLFHVLVDIGEGVTDIIKKGPIELGISSSATVPDALLITHSHDDHFKELPILLQKIIDNNDLTRDLKIFCTSECWDQVVGKFPQLSNRSNKGNIIPFVRVEPNRAFEVGPVFVIPVLAYHGDNSPVGSVIYILKYLDKKVVIGWDFLALLNVDENRLWNPDLLILGTQTYNADPETRMISVSDAYDIVRRWNAKERYVVHYAGLHDFEEASNQWFRGPVKAMKTEELQKTIDEHLRVTGDNGKFRIIVGKEGMIWIGEDKRKLRAVDESSSIGKVIEVESLQKYIIKMESIEQIISL